VVVPSNVASKKKKPAATAVPSGVAPMPVIETTSFPDETVASQVRLPSVGLKHATKPAPAPDDRAARVVPSEEIVLTGGGQSGCSAVEARGTAYGTCDDGAAIRENCDARGHVNGGTAATS
jgi:hypothetical protein